MVKVIKLNSDSIKNELLTIEAYQELKSKMSLDEISSHNISYVYVESFENVITLTDLWA